MIADLKAAVIERTVQDYALIRAKLNNCPIPIAELYTTRKIVIRKLDYARLVGDVKDISYFNQYISEVDKYIDLKSQADDMIDFFLGDRFDVWAEDLNGKALLEGVDKKFGFTSYETLKEAS